MVRQKNGVARKSALPRPRSEKIVSAAIRLYSRLGVGETGISDIAKEAGVPRPLVNYYFPKTTDLHRAVVGVVLESLKADLLAGLERDWKSPIEAIYQMVDSYFGWAEKNRSLYSIWLYFYYLSSFRDEFRGLNDSIRETGRERISALIYRAIEEKRLSLGRGTQVADLALAVQTALTGGFVMAYTEDSSRVRKISVALKRTLKSLLEP